MCMVISTDKIRLEYIYIYKYRLPGVITQYQKYFLVYRVEKLNTLMY